MKGLTLANLVSVGLILSVLQPAMSRGTDPGLHEGSLRQAVQYNVEVVEGQKRERIALDAITGAPIANPDQLYEEWSPVKLARASGDLT
jgi:hypothetical protein